MRRYKFFLLFLFFLFFCAPSRQKGERLRIVSLVPSVTEIIYALGKGNLLVGNTIYCNYPEEAKRVYKVGDFLNPSLERILLLKPNIVFLTLPTQKIIQEKLELLKIKTFASSPKDFSSLLQEIKEIARILGAEKEGESLAQYLFNEVAKVNFSPLKVYLEISLQPFVSVGKNSFLSDILEKRGLKNIFSDIAEEYPIVKIEEIRKRDPEVIIILHPLAKKADVEKRIGFESIKAVKEGKIIDDLNPDLFLRPGPRIVEGLRSLSFRLFSQ